jgi:hypothetical protein
VDSSAIWRLELQERDAPHFHLLYFGGYIHYDEIASRWNGIADPGNKAHLKAGTEIRSCESVNRIGPYLCKYLGKPSEDGRGDNVADQSLGRHWGVYNRNGLPISKCKTIPIPWAQASGLIEQELSKYTTFTTAKSRHTVLAGTPEKGRDYINEVLENEFWTT